MKTTKQYTVVMRFIEGVFTYIFTETDMKNPNGDTLFLGKNTGKRKMYILTYTEKTLNRLNAQPL